MNFAFTDRNIRADANLASRVFRNFLSRRLQGAHPPRPTIDILWKHGFFESRSRRFRPAGKSVVDERLRPTGINIPATHPDERGPVGDIDVVVPPPFRPQVDHSLAPHEDFQTDFLPNGRNDEATPRGRDWRFRCDARLIREAVEIDFRVGGGRGMVGGPLRTRASVLPPISPAPVKLYDHRKLPFILDENKSEKEDRLPWEM